ncbi:selenocysteine-specific translation elongation factor [Streptantibioticus rubrisoli]|uniref:Selenocysteine-specific translation elongation factor n=1 Tax=Streptantibioticus rubrisoli TaxID=1387313 RepID=A0ABT1PBD2_9ACTN|nr:selenocysteine-specific translation elongation factor [Streptantibioticus rubrisoli]MCQ4042683.1 selenocysteine-specific translation elongation factor [Streptantibioticus rubrisoli]
MHVIATAGHVDHGKSALVRALTGMEPDRWPEERRRGMTIDLGFVWTTMPGAGEVAFVDVPGHERLVTTMLAGVGPVPAVLFVVAADQGWQPQSQEHLAVLDALRVRHGVLAVTRSDLADPADVREQALARIARSSLGRVESVAVNAVTGEGLTELKASLARLVNRLPEADRTADVRLWVDRAFTVRGHGTVVTGTLAAGTVSVGDRLLAAGATGGDALLRVRGLESLKRKRTSVSATARVAVNVHGTAAVMLRRGSALLTPGRWLTTDSVDVRLDGDAAAELPRGLTPHLGSAAVPVRVRPLGSDTARLSLAVPLPPRVNDVALLRDPGRHHITGAATILDIRPPLLARRGAAALRAKGLDGQSGKPNAAAELRRRGLVRRADLAAMGLRTRAEPVVADWLCDPEHWSRLGQRLAEAVERHAGDRPTDPGLTVEAARRLLDLPERALVVALVQATDGLEHRAGRIYGSVTQPSLPPAARTAVQAVRARLAPRPFHAPEAAELAALGLTPKLLAAAAAAGELLRLPDGIVLLPDADRRAAATLARLDQPFTTSAARVALGTTRRVVVPLLEHLDRRGWTVRLDARLRRCTATFDDA